MRKQQQQLVLTLYSGRERVIGPSTSTIVCDVTGNMNEKIAAPV
jgi:hypothetical protein